MEQWGGLCPPFFFRNLYHPKENKALNISLFWQNVVFALFFQEV